MEALSKVKIEEFVNKCLQDKMINSELLPDWLERKLYVNILTLVIGLMKETLETSSVNFIGHQLVFDIKPIEN